MIVRQVMQGGAAIQVLCLALLPIAARCAVTETPQIIATVPGTLFTVQNASGGLPNAGINLVYASPPANTFSQATRSLVINSNKFDAGISVTLNSMVPLKGDAHPANTFGLTVSLRKPGASSANPLVAGTAFNLTQSDMQWNSGAAGLSAPFDLLVNAVQPTMLAYPDTYSGSLDLTFARGL